MLMLPTKTFDKQNTSIDFIFNYYSLRKLIKLVKEEKKRKPFSITVISNATDLYSE